MNKRNDPSRVRVRYIVRSISRTPMGKATTLHTAPSESDARAIRAELESLGESVEIMLADGYMRGFGYAPDSYTLADIRECARACVVAA